MIIIVKWTFSRRVYACNCPYLCLLHETKHLNCKKFHFFLFLFFSFSRFYTLLKQHSRTNLTHPFSSEKLTIINHSARRHVQRETAKKEEKKIQIKLIHDYIRQTHTHSIGQQLIIISTWQQLQASKLCLKSSFRNPQSHGFKTTTGEFVLQIVLCKNNIFHSWISSVFGAQSWIPP